MAQQIGVGDSSAEERTPIRLSDHPRARASIAYAKAWGAVIGFALAAWLGYRGGIPFVDLVVRAIAIGALSCLAVWGVAQAIWKQILFAELAAARKAAVEAQQKVLDELAELTGLDGTDAG
ncbi:MAG: hypothetical protein QM679_05365 [Patulibacter sp.]